MHDVCGHLRISEVSEPEFRMLCNADLFSLRRIPPWSQQAGIVARMIGGVYPELVLPFSPSDIDLSFLGECMQDMGTK